MTDYKPVIGAPFLRLYEDGTIRNVYGKPLKFGKDGTTTTLVGGKVCRVSREDILRCVAGDEDLSMLYPKRQKIKPPPSKRHTLRTYRQLSATLSAFSSAYITEDKRGIYAVLYDRIPNYVAHFRYTGLAEDYLRDVVFEAIDTLADRIIAGKVVVAPDRYIIEIVRTKLSQDVSLKRINIPFL